MSITAEKGSWKPGDDQQGRGFLDTHIKSPLSVRSGTTFIRNMLWFLMLILTIPFSLGWHPEVNIVNVETQNSTVPFPNGTVQLNVTWTFNNSGLNGQPVRFRLWNRTNHWSEWQSERYTTYSPCLANFSAVAPGAYTLTAWKDEPCNEWPQCCLDVFKSTIQVTETPYSNDSSTAGPTIASPKPTPSSPTNDSSPNEQKNSKTNTNAIIGGVIGGVAFLVLVAFALIYLRRRWYSNRRDALGFNKDRMVKEAPDADIDYPSPRSSFASMTGDTEKPLRRKDGR